MTISDDYKIVKKSCIEEAIKTMKPILVSSERRKKDFENMLVNMGFGKQEIIIVTLNEKPYEPYTEYLIYDPEEMIMSLFDVESAETFYLI